jgi:hypothetical protein
MEFLKHLFTEVDNTTADLSKLLAAMSIVNALGLSIYVVVWKGQPFDLQAYGMGIAALFAGTAALLKFKKDTSDSTPQ